MKIINYSEKAIALIGDTKPHKEILKQMNGAFNPRLTVEGKKTCGWIFGKKREPEVRMFVDKTIQPHIQPVQSYMMPVIHKAEQPETTHEIKQPEREAKTEPKQPGAKTDSMKLFVKMAKHIGKKSVIPVCDYIFFQNGKATATDIENIIQINSNEHGAVLINNLDKDLTFVEGQPFSNGIKIQKNVDPEFMEKMPVVPELKKISEYYFTNEDRENIIIAGDFIGKDEIRPVMNQVAVENGHIVATDAHKLFYRPTEAPNGFRFTPFIVAYLKNIKGGFKAYITDANIVIEGEITVISRFIDGIYPKYMSVIPESFSFNTVLPKKELIFHIEKAAKAANKSTRQVVLSFGEKLNISGQDADIGTEYSGDINVSTEPFRIGFNAKFLLQVLKHCPDKVKFEANEPKDACLFGGILLMPVKIDGGQSV